MSEHIKLTDESFNTLRNMLNSEDSENIILAFEAMEKLEFDINCLFICMLYMEKHVTTKIWSSMGRSMFNKLEPYLEERSDKRRSTSALYSDRVLTLINALALLIHYKSPIEDLETLLNKYTENLTKTLRKQGYDQIDNIKLTINTK